MTYEQFVRGVIGLPGVTYVGPRESPSVGVEGDEDARRLRPMIALSIPMFVTGKLVVESVEVVKHVGVETYERVAETTGSAG